MAGSTEFGNTPDKYRISGCSRGDIISGTGRKLFLRGANTAMKMNSAIAEDSAIGRKKFMARQWEALIGFCGVETWKKVQIIWKQI